MTAVGREPHVHDFVIMRHAVQFLIRLKIPEEDELTGREQGAMTVG